MTATESEHQAGAPTAGDAFKDCFARSCRHHSDGRCNLYTATHPPTITIDGTCLGYDL